jgi:hypothetical protein
MRPRHPDKHIEEAVQHAESLGWQVTMSRGHNWGLLWCPAGARGGCRLPVYSTPRVAEHHANWLRKNIDRCPHGAGE